MSARWNAAADVSELIASGGAALARYQPSQRYFLLDEGRVGDADLPGGNLVSALIALETSRDRERLPELLGSLIGLLREQGDEELTQAFRSWVAQVLLPRRFRGGESGWLPRLEEVRTMLAEQVREWTEEWVEEGREQGIAQGRAEERALLCRQAERKFDAATARRLVNRALCAGGDARGSIAAASLHAGSLCWHPRSISIPTGSDATPVAQPVPGVIESGARSR